MGRQAKGYRVRWKRGYAYAHFTWDSYLYRIALRIRKEGAASERAAEKAAARAHADVVSGRLRPIRRQPGQLLDLAELLDEWIEAKRPSVDPTMVPTLEIYARRYIDSFGSLDRITESSTTNYGLVRLGQAIRSTVLRELSYLREFLAWCKVHGVLTETPHVPRLPPKSQGTRTGRQRAKPIHISEAEAQAIIALLPKESKRIGGRAWPLRARFAFMWETALRPETLSRLAVPDHWRPGMRHVELTNEDDKARWGREVDLSDAAVRILEEVAPERGLIFGRHIFYKALKTAAAEVLGDERGRKFAPYDFRHGRAKQLIDDGMTIREVAFGLGHKRLTTTDRYVAPDRTAWKDGLARLKQRRKKGPGSDTIPAPKKRRRDGKPKK